MRRKLLFSLNLERRLQITPDPKPTADGVLMDYNMGIICCCNTTDMQQTLWSIVYHNENALLPGRQWTTDMMSNTRQYMLANFT